ncbi:hypothetical protein JCM1841_004611 [Sporobolomyces salmonicolor]
MAALRTSHTALPALAAPPIRPPMSLLPRLTFTQGVLLGQASMVILAVLFLKYVVFEDPEAAKREREEKRRVREEEGQGKKGKGRAGRSDGRTKPKAATPSSASPPSISAAALLSTLSYDLSTHGPESLDWLNVLLAQLISSYRSLASQHGAGGARGLMEEVLNRKVRGGAAGVEDGEGEETGGKVGMVGLDEIEVTEVDLGEGFPSLSDARVRPSGMGGEGVRVELDVDYTDHVSLALSTRVVMNFPRPRFAVLPISLSLTLLRFSGTLTVELPPPPAPSSPSSPHDHAHPTLHLSLHPDFTLDLATSSLLGSRAKLQDVPKVEQLLVARIRAAIQDRVVWPGRVEVALPGLEHRHHHPHPHHHHAQAEEHDDEDEADDWQFIDRPHPLAFPSASYSGAGGALPPSFFSVSDLQHRNADSDSDDDGDASPLPSRRLLPSDPTIPELDESPAQPDLDVDFGRARPRGSGPGSDARSRSRSTTPETPETPSVDLDAPAGPAFALHPKVRRRRSSLRLSNLQKLDQALAGGGGGGPREGRGGAAAAGRASPTESLPGYFSTRATTTALNWGAGLSAPAPAPAPAGAGAGAAAGTAAGKRVTASGAVGGATPGARYPRHHQGVGIGVGVGLAGRSY